MDGGFKEIQDQQDEFTDDVDSLELDFD